MIQNIKMKDMPFVIKGTGPIKTDNAIDLLEYVIPYDSTRINRYPVSLAPISKSFEMKIGGTTFGVHSHFSEFSNKSVLQQFKDLILSENSI